jgi:hypothetical protein
MRPKYAIVAVLVLLLAFASLAAQAVELKGKVRDSNGKPVRAVALTALLVNSGAAKPSVLAKSVSGDDGAYSLALPGKGEDECVMLVAYSPDKYLGWQCVSDGIGKASGTSKAVVTVFALRAVSGKVVDREGKPVSGTRIECTSFYRSGGAFIESSDGIFASQLSTVVDFRPVTADAEGRFTLPNVPGDVNAVVRSAEPKFALTPSILKSGRENKLTLVPGGEIKGIVKDENGKGRAQIAISIQRMGFMYVGPPGEEMYSSGDGSFRVSGLLPGNYCVMCNDEKNHTYGGFKQVDVKAGDATDIGDIVIPSGVPFSGKVVDASTGAPVPGIKVSAFSIEYAGAESVSDSQGRFDVKIVPGKINVQIEDGNGRYFARPADSGKSVTVTKAGYKGYVLKAVRGAVASGRVIDQNGKPVRGVEISTHTSGPGRDYSTSTAADGRFTLPVPPKETRRGYRDDKVIVRALDPSTGFGCVKSEDRDTLLKKGITLRLSPGRTLKVIVEDESGTPLSGAAVSLTHWSGNYGVSLGSEMTGEDGAAEFRNLYSGMSISIDAGLDGYYMEPSFGGNQWKMDDSAAEPRKVILKKLKSYTISGKLLDEAGKPVSGASISTDRSQYGGYPYASPPTESTPITSATDGTFTIFVMDSPYDNMMGMRDEQASVYLSAVDSSKHIGRTVKVPSSGDVKDLTITIKPERKLTVTVKDPSGKPIQGVSIDLNLNFGPGFPSVETSRKQLMTDSKGIVVCDGLYDGMPYSVSATLKGRYQKEYPSTTEVGGEGWTDKVTIVMGLSNKVVKGLVLDNAGKPVSGAKVTSGDVSTTSDAKGRFVLKNLSGNDVSIDAQKGNLRGNTWLQKSETECVVIIKKSGYPN